jgi:UDP-glucuronate decarboxylase
LVDGLVRLMNTSDDVTGPINLGNPEERTILDLAKKILDYTGSRSKIEFRPLPVNDPKQRQPDIAAASSVLGWKPRVAFEAGLKKTIAYFDNTLSATAKAAAQ